MNFGNSLRIWIISGILAIIGNAVGFKISPVESIPGMLILLAIVVAGYALYRVSPIKKLPTIAYISLIAIIASIPGFPGSEKVLQHVAKVELLALCTPILAYAGISIGKDLESFKQQGLKIVIVSLLTFAGTYLGSVFIAEIVMKITGVI